MPEPAKEDNTGLLIAIAVAAVVLWNLPAKSSVEPGLSGETSKVFSALKANYKALCLEAADLVEQKKLANEEALAKWLAPKTGAARDSAFAGFYKQLNEALPVEFDGKEAEVAATLRTIAGAW
jgi:hypothetical protein